jgi:hypothetical protein
VQIRTTLWSPRADVRPEWNATDVLGDRIGRYLLSSAGAACRVADDGKTTDQRPAKHGTGR